MKHAAIGLLLLTFVAVGQVALTTAPEEPYTKPQTWSKTDSYSGTPAKVTLSNTDPVLYYDNDQEYRFTIRAASAAGASIKLIPVVGEEPQEAVEIRATVKEVDDAIAADKSTDTATTKFLRALVKIGIGRLPK